MIEVHGKEKAIVILSGGQDSTTCLFWSKHQFDEVYALTFDYGQRHRIELESAKIVAEKAQVPHEVIHLGPILHGTSPLVSSVPVETYSSVDALPGGIEPTFVPARNALFLVIAANRAACLEASFVVCGVCEEDYGGYPDCRRVFIDAMERSLSLGLYGEEGRLHILTPLMHLTKKETVDLACSLDPCLDVLAWSHTCYQGKFPPCRACHACLLRERGFKEAGIQDPLLRRAGYE